LSPALTSTAEVPTETRWTVDRRAIETVVTLDVEAWLKGSLGRTVQFVVPGGALGRYRSIFVGAPQFVVEEAVRALPNPRDFLKPERFRF
jgi:hypothetical protein